MPQWSAELTIDEPLVRRLIADQFPEVELATLRPFAEGWDNAVWLADERWAFRFPRRKIAIPGVERELAILPRLAPTLPVGIPAPVFSGRPALGYPWPFFGAQLLPGIEAGEAELGDEARVRLAPALAGFLRRLHDSEVDGLPVDPNGRSDMPRRVAMAREQLAELGQAPPSADELFERALALPEPADTVVLHGDLHFRHLLVDEQGALTGVIDWGDVCCGDPSIDLSLLWSFFPREGREAFLQVYGPVSDDQLVRARVLAVSLCAALAAYGRAEGMSGVEREALEGLDRCLS